MALIKCPDCEKMISPRVQQCPFCGCPSEFFGDSGDNSIQSSNNGSEAESDSVNSDGNNGTASAVTDSAEKLEGVTFGLDTEQFPNKDKYQFAVIEDPERESDKHSKGKTHVVFRVGEGKYLTVAKDNLFYAPLEKQLNDQLYKAGDTFQQYLEDVSTLSGMTSGARDAANKIMVVYCQLLVELLVKFEIYDYDLKSFVSYCGSEILIENTDTYEAILDQKDNVDTYAQNLAYQRNVERSSRSQWVGGGFGVKGAIKGAVTAGAMNAATGAFRSLGDSMTDASDKSNVQAKYNAIVNNRNKAALLDDFTRGCLFRAKLNFYRILSEKSGWNAAEVLQENWDTVESKLNNIKQIQDKKTREKILIELLSEHPYHNDVLMYAISNFDEYDLNLGDLLHFVKRISMDSFELWMARNFSDSIKKIEESKSGEECKRALIDLGVTVGVIDNECNVIQTEEIDYGYEIIMSLIEAEMSEYGLSLKKLQEQVNDYDKAQSYFEKFAEIALKYHVINSPIVKNELRIEDGFVSNSSFSKLQTDINDQLKQICTVRDITCNDIAEAKLLSDEWEEFDKIYSPYDSYADYDSHAMQEVIDKMMDKEFKSKHVIKLISGEKGLESRKRRLEERERSKFYKKSKRIIEMMIPYAGADLFVYGSNGFIEKAKMVRDFDKIKDTEKDIFPIVIYDVSDSNGFKGFVLTDNYFYNYNSVWGIGFGDKAVDLYDVNETYQNGKNRFFKLSTGKTEKIKIIGYEDLIIGTLSEVHNWSSDLTRATNDVNKKIGAENGVWLESTVPQEGKRPCPTCGGLIAVDSKFCTFCGGKIEPAESFVDKEPCPNCGKMIKTQSKFCTFCGSTILRDENQPNGMTYSNPGKVDGNSMSKQEELVDKNVDVAEDD